MIEGSKVGRIKGSKGADRTDRFADIRIKDRKKKFATSKREMKRRD